MSRFLLPTCLLFILLLGIWGYMYYQDTKEIIVLINKYATSTPVANETDIYVRADAMEDTQTATAAASKSTKSKRTIVKNNSTATTTITQQKNIRGIAAGGVLTGMSENELRKYFSHLKTLGITWVRWDFNWSEIQKTSKDQFNWYETDLVSKLAKEYGLNTLGIIGYAPTWASDPRCTQGHKCSPVNASDYSAFVSIVVNRYKDRVQFWEIWNEPNSDLFWSPTPDAKKYSELLKESYIAIKKADPKAIVVTGGLSPVEGSDSVIDPLNFVSSLYQNGANEYFDAVSLHPYGYPLSPASIQPWNYWFQLYKVYDLMTKNGDANKKIWITEYGAPTGGAGSSRGVQETKMFVYGKDFMSEEAQAIMINDLNSEVQKISAWIGPVFWYSLYDIDSNSTDPENNFGLIKSDGNFKQSYYELLKKKK